jgi:transcriptional regulator with XRE-family HTH domain
VPGVNGEGEAVARAKMKAEFAVVLKGLRARAGLSQPALAKKAKVPLSTLRQYEQRFREPKWSVIVKLARGLGASLGDFEPGQAAAKTKERG